MGYLISRTAYIKNSKVSDGEVYDDYYKGETVNNAYYKPNYLAIKADMVLYNGKYNSPNLFPLSQLVEVNTEFQTLYRERISQGADETSGNTSYENSMFTPIVCQNYVIAEPASTYNDNNTPSGTYPTYSNTVSQNFNPTRFNGYKTAPYGPHMAMYYYSTVVGFNHSKDNEDYLYIPDTNKLMSVLDNYQGYEGEGGQIVYQYDENGNIKTEIVINEDGTTTEIPLIDETKTTYPTLADVDSSSPLSRRVYKSFKSYPKLVDFDNMSIKNSNVNVHTLTYNEISREIIDNNLKITVEALFQIKELEYNIDVLAYSKMIDSNDSKMLVDYENNYKFSPLIYVYNTEEFNPLKWSKVPETKKYEFNFCNDVVEAMDKIGKPYVAIEYEVDGELKTLKIEGTSVNAVKLQLSGNKSRKGFIKSLPQVFVAQGKTRLYCREDQGYLFENVFLSLGLASFAVIGMMKLIKYIPGIGKKAYNFWWDKIYALIAARRDMDCWSIGYSPRQTGDYFYNVGNKWTYIYHKCRAEKLHLWDKFENPSYSMNVIDRKNEKKVKLNPPAARVDSDRNFKQKNTNQYNVWTGQYNKVGLGYLERPFTFNALSTNEINAAIGKKSKFKGNYTENERKALLAKNLSYEESSNRLVIDEVHKYKDYNERTSGLTHVYQGQKFSMTFMLNNNFRRVQHLIKLAYIYCNYLCDIKGIDNGRKTISVTLSHRLPMYYFKKNLRLDRRNLSDLEVSLMDKNYEATMIGDWLWLYNKKKRTKIGFDFKTYIPDYRSHYGVGNTTSVIVKDNLIPLFKKIYSNGTFTEREYKSWNNFYKNNIDDISSNGLYLNIPKLDISNTTNHMETFLREYFGNKTNDELLQIYNEEMGTSYTTLIDTDSSTKKSLDMNRELNKFINNETKDEVNGTTTIINLHTNKLFHQKISSYVETPYTKNNFFSIRWVTKYHANLHNPEITYDVRNLCLLYQIELEKILQGTTSSYTEEEVEKIQNSFYTYIDSEIDTITKRDVLDLIIKKCQDIIPNQDYYLTLSEFNEIKASNNKYALMLDQDDSSPNSLLYQLWIGYYVVPNDVSEVVKELTSDGVTWKTILEKDATITRGIDNDPMYISPYLPMYQDVYKKIPYNMRIFLAQYCYTYDILAENLLIKKSGTYEAKIIKTWVIWGGLFVIWLAAVIAVVLYAASPFTGGASGVLATLLLISVVSTVLAAICITIGTYTNNPTWIKAAKVLQVIAAVTGLVAGGISEVKSLTAQNVSAAQIGFVVVQQITNVISIYHAFSGHTKDAIGWQIASMILGVAQKIDSAKNNISNNNISTGQLVSTSINIINQIMDIINEITRLIQENKLEAIADKIKELEIKNKELEEELEKEKDEFAQETNPFAALTSKKPISLLKYDNAMDNILPTIDNSLANIDTDTIIEAQFEVLES